MRGEDAVGWLQVLGRDGAPPRAWGGRVHDPGRHRRCRSTPTCVGRTARPARRRPTIAEHPHVRGEDSRIASPGAGSVGAPPRAWGGQIGRSGGKRWRWSTPTCVGRTGANVEPRGDLPEHPHVRGEDSDSVQSTRSNSGAPPRAWGGHFATCVFIRLGSGLRRAGRGVVWLWLHADALRAETNGGGWIGVDQDGADVGIWGKSNRLLRPYPVLWHLIDLSRRPATGRTRRRLGARRPLSLCGRHA